MKVYSGLAPPRFLHGSEIWTLTQKDKKAIVIEIKFLRRTAGYIFVYHKRKEETLEQLKLEPVDEKIRETNQINYGRSQE